MAINYLEMCLRIKELSKGDRTRNFLLRVIYEKLSAVKWIKQVESEVREIMGRIFNKKEVDKKIYER